ncbi:MAG: hypothetical protein DRI90_17670 [Deltaproteobacteria bacterium]|nr:MAG: hypothetical protein DRI90_17670 [Deltaproteobacteria bacterium]
MAGESHQRPAPGIAPLVIAGCFGALSCQQEPTTRTTSGSLTTFVPAATAAAGTTSAVVKPSQPRSPHAGPWTGSYDTAQGKVDVPAGVSYPTWTKDDGTLNNGKGTVALTIAADGVVSGRVTGALGALTVAGVLESGWLRAGLTPADPEGTNPMTGVLLGEVKGDQITAQLRVANHDGSLVRKAKVALEPSR